VVREDLGVSFKGTRKIRPGLDSALPEVDWSGAGWGVGREALPNLPSSVPAVHLFPTFFFVFVAAMWPGT
jgi:hypothetical protein